MATNKSAGNWKIGSLASYVGGGNGETEPADENTSLMVSDTALQVTRHQCPCGPRSIIEGTPLIYNTKENYRYSPKPKESQDEAAAFTLHSRSQNPQSISPQLPTIKNIGFRTGKARGTSWPKHPATPRRTT